MRKLKGTIWTGKPNFKKMMRERREKEFLKIAVLVLCIFCGLLFWYISSK